MSSKMTSSRTSNDFLNTTLLKTSNKLEINERVIEEKRENEIKSFLLVAFASIGFGLTNFHGKLTNYLLTNSFDPVSFMMYRSMSFMFISYYTCQHKGIKITRWDEVKNKFCFCARTFGAYISSFTFLMCSMYFRASTAACINSMYPAIFVFISIILLNDRFYMRYIYGFLICSLGSVIIILNENNDVTKNIQNNILYGTYDTYWIIICGSLYGVANLMATAFVNVSIKILMNEKIENNVQCYWVGFTNLICSFVHILFSKTPSIYLPYIMFCFCGGIILYLSNHLLVEGYKNIQISKTATLGYLSTITVFILGVLVLGEQVYISDLIGTLMIISYNLYNVYFPAK